MPFFIKDGTQYLFTDNGKTICWVGKDKATQYATREEAERVLLYPFVAPAEVVVEEASLPPPKLPKPEKIFNVYPESNPATFDQADENELIHALRNAREGQLIPVPDPQLYSALVPPVYTQAEAQHRQTRERLRQAFEDPNFRVWVVGNIPFAIANAADNDPRLLDSILDQWERRQRGLPDP